MNILTRYYLLKKISLILVFIFFNSKIFGAGWWFSPSDVNVGLSGLLFLSSFLFICFILAMILFLIVRNKNALKIFVISYIFAVTESIILLVSEASVYEKFEVMTARYFMLNCFYFFLFILFSVSLMFFIYLVARYIFSWIFIDLRIRKISFFSFVVMLSLILSLISPPIFFELLIVFFLLLLIKKNSNLFFVFLALAFSASSIIFIYTYFSPKIFSISEIGYYIFYGANGGYFQYKKIFDFEIIFMLWFCFKIFISSLFIFGLGYLLYKFSRIEKLKNKIKDKFSKFMNEYSEIFLFLIICIIIFIILFVSVL